MLEITAHQRPEHLPVHPELTGLLLGQRIGAISAAHRAQGRTRVRATEMIALPATAVIQDRFAAVRGLDACEPRRDLTDGRVPIDCFERPVGATSHRRRDALRAVLVVVETQRLFTGVALRGGVVLVATDANELPARLTAELDLDPAVALAQDAGALVPGSARIAGLVRAQRSGAVWLGDRHVAVLRVGPAGRSVQRLN
jgi:hypothetical protein